MLISLNAFAGVSWTGAIDLKTKTGSETVDGRHANNLHTRLESLKGGKRKWRSESKRQRGIAWIARKKWTGIPRGLNMRSKAVFRSISELNSLNLFMELQTNKLVWATIGQTACNQIRWMFNFGSPTNGESTQIGNCNHEMQTRPTEADKAD